MSQPESLEPLSRRAKLFARGVAWRALRLGGVFAVIAAMTFVCSRWIHVNATTAGFIYLIAILLIAAGWGFLEAVAGSVLAVLCFNFFFLEPVGTLNIADPQNWVALAGFLATSLVASQLSARARERTREALDRRREMEKLYALSRAILLMDTESSPAAQIAHQIQDIFGFPAVALYDHKAVQIHHAGPGDLTGIEDRLRQAAVEGVAQHDEARDTVLAPIRLGGHPVGSLAILAARASDAAVQALANLVAIALEKVRGQEAANRAEAARQSQELKSTLLDSLAHEFKTPLTSIKAAATALLSTATADAGQQRELISIVDEEVDHLARLVTRAVQMARIEAGEVRLEGGLYPARKLIGETLEQMKTALEERTVTVGVADDLPPLFADAELLKLALWQLLDNAAKYSPPGSPVGVRAERSGRAVVISVQDEGPGIPEREQPRVFERFYRSPSTRQHVMGTGMGLAIAREIVRAHGGDIGVESKPGRGSRFWIAVPESAKEKVA